MFSDRDKWTPSVSTDEDEVKVRLQMIRLKVVLFGFSSDNFGLTRVRVIKMIDRLNFNKTFRK